VTESANKQSDESSSLSLFGAVVRAALNTAPFTGGIASLWSDLLMDRQMKRVQSAIQEMAEQLLRLKTFDPSRIGEAEMHLLDDALQRVAREHREEKRKMFARLLAVNWVNVTTPFDERLYFQQALDDFNQIHLRLLHLLRLEHKSGREAVPSADLCSLAFGTGLDEETKFGVFVPALNKIAAQYGLVR
jgi:hypothetical protein